MFLGLFLLFALFTQWVEVHAQGVVPLGLHGSPEYVDLVKSPRWSGSMFLFPFLSFFCYLSCIYLRNWHHRDLVLFLLSSYSFSFFLFFFVYFVCLVLKCDGVEVSNSFFHIHVIPIFSFPSCPCDCSSFTFSLILKIIYFYFSWKCAAHIWWTRLAPTRFRGMTIQNKQSKEEEKTGTD